MIKGNLLLIDDEVLLLEKTAMLLEDIADNVYTASSGEIGLKILSSNTIHCILCDINMPEMNGVEVLKNVRNTHPDLPFIFYTGHGSRDLMKEAIKYGAFDFLDKPYLEGLEDIVSSGLQAGLGKNSTEGKSQTSITKEYANMIKRIEAK